MLPPIAQPMAPHIPGLPGTDPLNPLSNPQNPAPFIAPQVNPTSELAAAPDPNSPEVVDPSLLPGEDGVLHTTAQVAHELRVSEDQFFTDISVPDSDGTLTPLVDVLNTWRANPDAIAVAAQRDTLEDEFLTRQTEAGQMHDEALARTGRLIQFLATEAAGSQVSQYDMDRMRAEDPAAYNAERTRQGDAEQRLNQARADFQAQGQERVRQQESENEARRTIESRKVNKLWPEYGNPVTRPAVQAQMQTYLSTHGYSRDEIAGLMDSRQFGVIKDAMAFRAMEKEGKQAILDAQQKGVPLPKAAPTARREALAPQVAGQANEQVLMQRAAQTGSVDDAALVIQNRMNQPRG